MPAEGIKLLRHEDILSFDEIVNFTEVAVRYGINKVRITGGEPLVRKGIVTLVSMISEISGINDLSMTTNGVLLRDFAYELKNAGLHRVNISLDTTDPEKFAYLTRGGKIKDVFEGIAAAKNANLSPVKINCVIRKSKYEEDARRISDFGLKNNLEIRFIRQMDLVNGYYSTVEGGTGGNCELCNRLRLTASGRLKPCLFNDLELDIRELGYEEALMKAVKLKPESGSFSTTGKFYNIGG
jgi:cyclic pyranopterin phosphate synthase